MFATSNANDLVQVQVPKGFRDRIIAVAREHYARQHGQELSAAISAETQAGEDVIDWIAWTRLFALEARCLMLEAELSRAREEAKAAYDDVEAEPFRRLVRTRKQASRARCA